MDGFIHFIKHFLGLCGETHPSVLVTGGIFLTSVSIYFKQIISNIKDFIS
jgi:hypothetical protein|tara:strand:+ start:308 stop:457 length:150 start_codon:yes stop_codon:yes gene_type:complete